MKVTIIKYHYVRDLDNSEYSNIKGRKIEEFIEQIKYFMKHYNIISMETFLDSLINSTLLPPKSILLTFDDGYSDHYNNVYPFLLEENLSGAFFLPFKAINEKIVLDVNKIQLILSVVNDHDLIINEIFDQLSKYKEKHNLFAREIYFNKLAVKDRWDNRKVNLIKGLLQHALPCSIRKAILNYIFKKYITNDEKGLSQQFYMSYNNAIRMKSDGMHIGNHSYNHDWLSTKSKQSQENDIDKSLLCLRKIIGDDEPWTMSYPYGDYNHDTIDVAANRGCKAGFSLNTGVADMSTDGLYELPCLDTNDFPIQRDAAPNEFYNEGF
jgi:peptidoglycan/xylan/chitin deacetylase (PgdA/CDA1 family)